VQSFSVTGRAARLEWNFGDGPAVTNDGWLASHTWTNADDYPVTLTAFNADNPAGVAASVIIHVLPVPAPLLSAGVVNTNVFQRTFPGQTNLTWILESATNLAPPVTWSAVQMLTGSGGVLSASVPNVSNPPIFYRLRQP
jgi:PKD repeat protein